jgi:hypothetical protein
MKIYTSVCFFSLRARSLFYLEISFCIYCKVSVQMHFFVYLISFVPFAEETVLSPWNDFGTLVRNLLFVYVYFRLSVLFHWICFSYKYHSVLICVTLRSKFWNQKVWVFQLFCCCFLPEIVLDIQDPLYFYTNVRASFVPF